MAIYFLPPSGLCPQVIAIACLTRLSQPRRRQLLHTLLGRCDLHAAVLFFCRNRAPIAP